MGRESELFLKKDKFILEMIYCETMKRKSLHPMNVSGNTP